MAKFMAAVLLVALLFSAANAAPGSREYRNPGEVDLTITTGASVETVMSGSASGGLSRKMLQGVGGGGGGGRRLHGGYGGGR